MILMVKFIFMWNPSVLSLLTKMSCSILVFNKFCLGVNYWFQYFTYVEILVYIIDMFFRKITNV